MQKYLRSISIQKISNTVQLHFQNTRASQSLTLLSAFSIGRVFSTVMLYGCSEMYCLALFIFILLFQCCSAALSSRLTGILLHTFWRAPFALFPGSIFVPYALTKISLATRCSIGRLESNRFSCAQLLHMMVLLFWPAWPVQDQFSYCQSIDKIQRQTICSNINRYISRSICMVGAR